MKKLIIAFILLLGALVILLATIDLEPFLAPERMATKERNETTQPRPAAPLTTGNEAEQPPAPAQMTPDKPGNTIFAEQPPDEIYPEQEQVVMAHQSKPAAVRHETTSDLLASPIELEVTTLPPGDYPFSILVGTFQKKETAERAVSLYRQRGIATFWVHVDLEQRGERYRQFTGFFPSMTEAQQYLAQSGLVDKLVKPTTYAALVGIYTDKSKLADAFVKTEQAGLMPYILGTNTGDYFLYVGAFYTQVGAVDQCQVLTAAGLSCEPVERATLARR